MLSKVAERIYWMCRYLERVENTARLVAVYGELLLDLPEEAELDWRVPLHILGLGDALPEGDLLEFLLRDEGNTASLLSSMHQARENARTTRDVMPSEAWQAINEMHLFVDAGLKAASRSSGRQLPTEIVRRCHEITGIIEGGMSHGTAYPFACLGRSLERADMTSRMLDVAASIMLSGREELQHHTSNIWRGVLRALSAYQMYRQSVRRRIVGEDVVCFLLLDPDFPRSFLHCVARLDTAAAGLPRNEATRSEIGVLRERLAAIDLQDITFASVHQLVDDLQIELAALDRTIYDTWLNPVRVA